MMHKILILVFSCLLSTLASAQAIKVSGKLVDENQQAVEAAVVILTRIPDNRMLEYSMTDKQGNFVLQHDRKVTTQLIIKHLSYGTETITLPEQCDTIINITLLPAPHEIEEVEVKGKRVPIQFKNGDWVINVENYIYKGTERTTDVLKKLPGVFVSEGSKQVTLNGKPVELQIDGQKQPVTYELLKALPATLLNQIVLIPNKRAEHDGDAGAAIIDVKTKKKYIDGYLGSVDGNYGTYRGIGWPGEVDATFFTMLMKKDFYFNVNAHTEVMVYDENIFDSTYYNDSQNYIANQQRLTGNAWVALTNMNFSWNIKNGHRLSANLYALKRMKDESSATESIDLQRSVKHYNVDTKGGLWNVSGNVEYETSDSLPFKLKLSYGYIGAGNKSKNKNYYYYPDSSDLAYTYRGDQDGSQHILKTDFRKFFLNHKVSFNAGVKFSFGKTKDDSRYDPVSESLKNEFFDYREYVTTGYISVGWQVSNKVYMSAGMRTEHTNYDLKLKSTTEHGSNKYWNWLPFASASFNLHKNYITTLSLASAIGRPSYNMLSPGEMWSNDRYYSKGNPFLQPFKNYSLTWGNQIFQKLNLNLGGQYVKDQYSQVLLDKGQEITESTHMSGYDLKILFANLTFPLYFLDGRLITYLTGNGQYGKYGNFKNGFVMPADRNRIYNLSAYFGFEVFFTKQRRLHYYMMGQYSILSKSFQNDSKKPVVDITMGIDYQVMKNRPLYITGLFTDVFNIKRTENMFHYGNNTRYYRHREKSQGFFIGLTYEFQGGRDLKRKEIRKDVNEEDKRFEEN